MEKIWGPQVKMWGTCMHQPPVIVKGLSKGYHKRIITKIHVEKQINLCLWFDEKTLLECKMGEKAVGDDAVSFHLKER